MRFRLLAFLISALLPLQGRVIRMDGSFVSQLQKRDSILIADQIVYGFRMDSVPDSVRLAYPEIPQPFMENMVTVRPWQTDTLKVHKVRSTGEKSYDIVSSIVVAPFEAGRYELPPLFVERIGRDEVPDTLVFDPQVLDVTTIQIDTATFVPHDIKGQMGYPLTFKEILPYLLGILLLAGLVALAVALIRRRKAAQGDAAHRDPAYIVALRKLEGFRGDKYWAPEKQKTYYSGITDTLREYIAETFGIDAKEMTTAEIFDALKGNEKLTDELYGSTKELFELADFVKFAKHVADDSENAAALPLSVRFVTSTYQSVLEDETPQAGTENGKEVG